MSTWLQQRLIAASILLAALALAPACKAQSPDDKGIDSGDYNIRQSVEFGYRANWVNGNQDTYNTFVHMAEGVRLLDYTLDMRSLDHNGPLFDSLSFSNFGYGGDPVDVTRLRIQKNKIYDFRVQFRRDRNFWDWPLLANPLNPTTSTVVNPVPFSPHTLDLVRRMQDYDLTILPQSWMRFRLGYSRNVDEGPSLTTLDSGTEPLLNQNYRVTTNQYHVGVDYRALPRTTISYDQFLKYYKDDTFTFDQIPNTFPTLPAGFNQYQLANSTPVDLGIVWNTTATSGTPCGAPITDPTTVPPTVKSNCQGFVDGTLNGLPLPGYARFARPRTFIPTERLSFQSNYFDRLEISGALGYSSGKNAINDFAEIMDGWSSRTVGRGNVSAGLATATRVSVNGDFSAIYSLSDKARLVDFFRYDNWRIPGQFEEISQNLFGTPPGPGQSGLTLPISAVTPANFAASCPASPYNQAACPQHSTSSLADFEDELFTRFLGQNLKTNTFQLEYDFNRRLSGRVGYLYTNRKIADFNAVTDVAEIYLPGGTAGTTANFFLAARADCAVPMGGTIPPADCTVNPDGSITEVGPEAGNDTSRNITTINEHALLVGVTARPTDKLRLVGDMAIGYNDASFTRTSPRQIQSYKLHANYKPQSWAVVDGAIEIHENRDNVFTVGNLEHDRMYSFSTTLAPQSKLSVDFGYNYSDFFSTIDICYAGTAVTGVTTPCPIIAGASPLGANNRYKSTTHFAYGNLMWKPYKRVTAMMGYSGSFTRGTSLYFNQPQFVLAPPVTVLAPVVPSPNTPAGTLDFNYLTPQASIFIDIYRGLSYRVYWNYYGYNAKGPGISATLAPIGNPDFNGSTATFAFRYAF
ncbi:MAG: hypothetical protein WB987_14135 [Candidatus Acidiferrales bacterium]